MKAIATWSNGEGEKAELLRVEVGVHRLKIYHGGRLVTSFTRGFSQAGNSPEQVLEWAEKQLQANFYILMRDKEENRA